MINQIKINKPCQLIRGLINIKAADFGCVATIGNFDGVHLGHQALLKKLVKLAAQYQLPSLVILFEPQPNEYFKPDKIPPRLMRLREKILVLQQLNMDRVLCIRFNHNFAEMTAEQFIEQILLKKLGVRHLIIGDDFHFGHKRLGNFELLQRYTSPEFIVEKIPSYQNHQVRISSTKIRHLLEQGDLNAANQLLGHPFCLSGRVAHGHKRGRIIGFPTANIYLHRKAVPILGVFAVKMYGLGNEPKLGVANVGNRPTVDGTRSLLEVHLFDFNQDIYGRQVTVEFLHKLRDEKKYDSFELLRQQILRDADNARAYFNKIGYNLTHV